ncbi:MAG: stage 0 sporulation family protein [Clostridiales bacterium]|nr:stage 0 sporulation family protein [Clostridiales bacterium]
MAIIVGIKFKHSTKSYYFDPVGIEFKEGDGAIVETARGVEFGTVTIANKDIDEKDIVQPLKPVIRKATEKDLQQVKKNEEDKPYAMQVFIEKSQKLGLQMKLVDAEYTFDRHKLMFYFTANGRVDFRELVRELAGVFKVRIELRQIYERDDIKMRGGLAPCGRPCCCTVHLHDFEKVTIKMAKLQGLSLNPTKINGCCGRLMCCLKYENDYYQEIYSQMPKLGSIVKTKDGKGIVEANDIIRQTVTVKVELPDGLIERRSYKLSDIVVTKKQSESEIEDCGDEILEEDNA